MSFIAVQEYLGDSKTQTIFINIDEIVYVKPFVYEVCVYDKNDKMEVIFKDEGSSFVRLKHYNQTLRVTKESTNALLQCLFIDLS